MDAITEYNDLSEYIPVQWQPDQQTVQRQFRKLERNGRLTKVLEYLRIFEPRLRDIRLLSTFGDSIHWTEIKGVKKPMPLKVSGEGLNRMSHVFMTMMAEELNVLFIDEVENGIHYSVQKDVWKAIGQVAHDQDIQVFATTHSLEMIRAAYEAFSEEGKLDEFRYHRLDRGRETGDIEAVTYNELDMQAVASFDFDHEVR